MTIRMLVVEDEIDIRRGIAIELAHADWQGESVEILEAEDVDPGLALLDASDPVQLILTDIMMPSGVDAGLTLISRLKLDPRWRRIPVIVLSARTASGDILEALRRGAMDYLVKPYAPDDLLERVRRAADIGRALQIPARDPADVHQRKRLAEAMKVAILYWELTTQRTKIQFADESGLWRVYIDNRGTCSTKTLDKYLHQESMPANPKVHLIEKSVHYVLAQGRGHEEIRRELQALLESLSGS